VRRDPYVNSRITGYGIRVRNMLTRSRSMWLKTLLSLIVRYIQKMLLLMKKLVFTIALFALCSSLGATPPPLGSTPMDDCKKDVNDHRGKMTPWEKGGWETGEYRNVFFEAGYKQEEIDAKLVKTYHDLFEGPNRVYFEVGDSMAYVSDLKNHDARTEGLSYGMMIAVQLNKKDVFDRLWHWTKEYMQHQGGARDGYFAWSVNPKTGKHNSEGTASDGELYFVTDLLFAFNRWGNNTGIDYYAEARRILDAMWSKDGSEGINNIINVEHKQISFVPESDRYHLTDPSYYLPAFFEIWAEYANDGHEQFYRDCADKARLFLHRVCHVETGLNSDITEYSGEPPTGGFIPSAFRFDSWRVPMNIAMDYSWYAKDKEWQQNYAKRIQNFLFCRGIDTFEDQFNVDGTLPEWILPAGGYRKLRHSLGLVSTSAAASLMGTQAKSWRFVDAVWNAKLEPYSDGYFDPYYDGLLYLFSLMHLSGNYRIITPEMKFSTASGGVSSRHSGKPEGLIRNLDSRFRGNDRNAVNGRESIPERFNLGKEISNGRITGN
jgi:oligosaccharide reducing-end xylanase